MTLEIQNCLHAVYLFAPPAFSSFPPIARIFYAKDSTWDLERFAKHSNLKQARRRHLKSARRLLPFRFNFAHKRKWCLSSRLESNFDASLAYRFSLPLPPPLAFSSAYLLRFSSATLSQPQPAFRTKLQFIIFCFAAYFRLPLSLSPPPPLNHEPWTERIELVSSVETCSWSVLL